MKNIMKLAIYAVIGLLIIVFVSCSDKPTSSIKIVTEDDEFPMAVGMYWTYAVYDSLTSKTDTMRVSIVDTFTTNDGYLALKWNYMSNSALYAKYMALFNDTVLIASDSQFQYPMEKFVFPIDAGALWIGPYAYDDTSRVAVDGSISVPAGSFDNGNKIDRVWQRDFEGGGNYSTTWIVPDVGMVYLYRLSQYSDGATLYTTINESWELISYNLYTFNLEQFPNTVGAEWIYEVYDNSSKEYDTLRVIIADTTTMSDSSIANIWTYDYGHRIDTEYVVENNNRIEFYSNREFVQPGRYLEFPLTIGRHWGIDTFVPIPDIIEKGSINTIAGKFDAGFMHIDAFYGFNYDLYLDSWFVPNVGLVFRTTDEINLGPMTTTTWNLIEYSMPEE